MSCVTNSVSWKAIEELSTPGCITLHHTTNPSNMSTNEVSLNVVPPTAATEDALESQSTPSKPLKLPVPESLLTKWNAAMGTTASQTRAWICVHSTSRARSPHIALSFSPVVLTPNLLSDGPRGFDSHHCRRLPHRPHDCHALRRQLGAASTYIQ